MKKQDIRIDFINFVESPDESISYPMGILYISAYLKQHGFKNIGFTEHVCLLRKIHEERDTKQFSFYTKEKFMELQKDNQGKVLNYLIERNPHLILLGPVTSFHLIELTDIVERIRELLPESIILSGGPHFGKESTLDKEYLRHCNELDALVIGEAEETILEIAELLLSCNKLEITPTGNTFYENLSKIKGVLTHNNELNSRISPKLCTLPLPDIQLLEDYWQSAHVSLSYIYQLSSRRNPVVYTDYGYFQGDSDWGYTEDDFHHFPTHSWRSGQFPYGIIVGSRGCPNNCTFCCSSGPRRIHSAQYVYDQIRYMKEKHKTSVFVFFESLFTTASPNEQKRVSELCRMVMRSDLDINYMIDIRADILSLLPDDLLESMIVAGCKEFNIGFEKGSDNALELIQKGTTTDQHFKAVDKVREIASHLDKTILLNGTFILGGPQETKKDVSDTVIHSWLLHLDNVNLYPLEIHPGSQIYRDAIEGNVIPHNLEPYMNLEKYPIYETDDVPLSYMCSIVDSNNVARKTLSDLLKTLRELELQFNPHPVDLTNIIFKETKEVNELFWDYIDTLFTCQSKDSIKTLESDINDEINQVESRLVHHFQYWGEDMNRYQFGKVSRSMKYCVTSLNKLSKLLKK